MNPDSVTLMLIINIYSQLMDAERRIAELEAQVVPEKD